MLTKQLENAFVALKNRSFVNIKGPDTIKFLQGFTTNQMNDLVTNPGIYTGFLNAQGRMLFDAFIFRLNEPTQSLLIDCSSLIKQDLIKHLSRYKMRNQVSLLDVSEHFSAYQVWTAKQSWDISIKDPRHSSLGTRIITSNQSHTLSTDLDEHTDEEYNYTRIKNGIPEGPSSIIPGVSLPLESNLDLMNGVDFKKGCYLGQELTIRTFHTGVVRKRIVPIKLFKNLQETQNINELNAGDNEMSKGFVHEYKSGQDIIDLKGNRVGKYLEGVGNMGIALFRLNLCESVVDLPNGIHLKVSNPLNKPTS